MDAEARLVRLEQMVGQIAGHLQSQQGGQAAPPISDVQLAAIMACLIEGDSMSARVDAAANLLAEACVQLLPRPQLQSMAGMRNPLPLVARVQAKMLLARNGEEE